MTLQNLTWHTNPSISGANTIDPASAEKMTVLLARSVACWRAEVDVVAVRKEFNVERKSRKV